MLDTISIPASPLDIRKWLGPIAATTGAADWQVRMLAQRMAGMPASLFDQFAQDEAVIFFDRWPTDLSLREWLRARHVEITPPQRTRVQSIACEQSSRIVCSTEVVPITWPVRERSEKHRRFVASHPCCICGRTDVQAHHLTHAMPGLKAKGLKVSDAYTAPLCVAHHAELHADGAEARWWASKGIDGIAIANGLWRQSNGLPA